MLNLQPIEYVGRAPSRPEKKHPNLIGGWVLLLMTLGIGFVFIRPMVPFLQSKRAHATKANAERAIGELKESKDFAKWLAAAALARTTEIVEYDSGYYDLSYPGGDLPSHKGICADLVVRSYRSLGVDLQELVHEDMAENFRLYPQLWERKEPDSNIDHRRVPNLQRYFSRYGKELENSPSIDDYEIGDVVSWRLSFGALEQGGSHIGIVVPGPGARSDEKWVVHNIGSGPEWEDKLFGYEIVGHYRFAPGRESSTASAENEAGISPTSH